MLHKKTPDPAELSTIRTHLNATAISIAHSCRAHLLDAVPSLAQVLQQPHGLRAHARVIVPRQQVPEHRPAQLAQQLLLQLRLAAECQVLEGPQGLEAQLRQHAAQEAVEGLGQAGLNESLTHIGEVKGQVAHCARCSHLRWCVCVYGLGSGPAEER